MNEVFDSLGLTNIEGSSQWWQGQGMEHSIVTTIEICPPTNPDVQVLEMG